MSESERALQAVIQASPDAARVEIEARLANGESPDDILESLDSLDLLAATAGDDAMTEAEADAMFAAVLDAVDPPDEAETEEPAALEEPANNNRFWLGAAALIAAAVALVAVPLLSGDDYRGIKGDGDLSAPQLSVFLGDANGAVGRRVRSGETLPTGTRLLFRYRSAQPAQAVLLAHENGASTEVWRTDTLAPGDHEVATDGQLLAWTADTDVEFGLRLFVEPLADTTLDASCGADDPCTRFTLDVE